MSSYEQNKALEYIELFCRLNEIQYKILRLKLDFFMIFMTSMFVYLGYMVTR